MKSKDVVVVGSGGGGLAAAVVAAKLGLDVLLIEKTSHYGGATALSGGGLWVPGSSLAVKAGIRDPQEVAFHYVEQVVGPTLDKPVLQSFLDAAPQMVDFMQSKTAVQFELQYGFPDWKPEAEGATENGRLLSPVEYDGKALGEHFAELRVPLSEFNAPGGFMIGLGDMPHLTNFTKSMASFKHMAKLGLRFAVDRMRYPRGTRLTMGNALVARLMRSALDAKVEMWSKAAAVELKREGSRVTGVVIERNGQRIEVAVRRGVVLASGGFSANPKMRAQYIPYAEHHISLVPEGNTGDGLHMGMAAGGVMEEKNLSNGAWTVMSLSKNPDGSVTKFPHLFLDRPKPGCIAVNAHGERFGDEADMNMVEQMHSSGSVPAHLICDHRFIKKYGLGMVKPGGMGLKKYVDSGYIITAPTLSALAQRIGADPAGLEKTVARSNEYARQGHDPEFGKGSTPADRGLGDPQHKPNPCLGPVETAPFYAVKIYPGDSTTTLGLRVNGNAQVLDASGRPVAGLYAVGLDMNSLWRGRAPGNGANNSLSMTFGYLAARDMAQEVSAEARPAQRAAG